MLYMFLHSMRENKEKTEKQVEHKQRKTRRLGLQRFIGRGMSEIVTITLTRRELHKSGAFFLYFNTKAQNSRTNV